MPKAFSAPSNKLNWFMTKKREIGFDFVSAVCHRFLSTKSIATMPMIMAAITPAIMP